LGRTHRPRSRRRSIRLTTRLDRAARAGVIRTHPRWRRCWPRVCRSPLPPTPRSRR
jgi:hypothetical protein